LGENGESVKLLFLMNEVPSAFPSALAESIETFEDIDVHVAVLFNDVDEQVIDSDLVVHQLDGKRRLDIRAYRSLRRLIRDQNIDILHTHPNATGSIARLVAATTDVKIVDTRHNDHRHFSRIQRLPNVPASAVTDRYISNSRNTLESFSRLENTLLRLNGGSHEVVYNGVDPTQFQNLPPRPEVLPANPLIVCVARYVPQKNHETLVRAMQYVRREVPDATLVLVGRGPKFEEIEALIRALELDDVVLQTGYLPKRDDVFSAVKHADLFAISSWYEGFCVAAVEAMMAGTPVVASDIPVLHEVVAEGGRFAQPDDPAAFGEQIVELLRDENARRRLGDAAHDRAHSELTLERTAEGYARVYRDLMDET
jgi:glycosyltransferase involved in cell wall biosynthesis